MMKIEIEEFESVEDLKAVIDCIKETMTEDVKKVTVEIEKYKKGQVK